MSDKVLIFLFLGIFIALFICWIVWWQIYTRKKLTKTSVKENNKNNKLLNQYKSLTISDDLKLNEVKLVNNGLIFSAKGKFGCKKNFNDIEGYHFAFCIEGKKLIFKPDNYNDVIDYEHILFQIDLGYFDGELLSDPENETGIVFGDLKNIEGKKVKFDFNGGMVAQIHTAETDDITEGEIEFVKWNNRERIILIKCLVDCGVYDIVVGKIKLDENKSFNKLEINEASKEFNYLIKNVKSCKHENEKEPINEDEIKHKMPYLPQSYIDFSKKISSAELNEGGVIYGLNNKINKPQDEERIEKYNAVFDTKIKPKDWYFFASSLGYEYAFSIKDDDGKVYEFNDNSKAPFINCNSFTDFLIDNYDF